MILEIVPSTIEHTKELSETIRLPDRLEAERLGFTHEEAILDSFNSAVIRKTCLVDGKVAAMFGVIGTLFGKIGVPYFITSTTADIVSPLVFARTYKREFNILKNYFESFENIVDSEYHGAIRLLKIVGFTIHKPRTLGPDEHMFCRFTYE